MTASKYGVCSSAGCKPAYEAAQLEASKQEIYARRALARERAGVKLRSLTPAVPCGNCGQDTRDMTGFCRRTPECRRAREPKYRELRLELKQEIARRWRDNHPDQAFASWKRHRQKEGRICRYAECSNILKPGQSECSSCQAARHQAKQAKLKQLLIRRDGWQCTWCGESLLDGFDTTEIDHVIPVSLGGPRDPQWNQQVLHQPCNRAKINLVTARALSVAAEHGYELVDEDGRQAFRRIVARGMARAS